MMPCGFYLGGGDMVIQVHTRQRDYDIILERGVLSRASQVIANPGHPFLISDDGVPEVWRNMLKNQYPDSRMYVFRQGEGSKCMETYQSILAAMLAEHVSRNDTVIALGGGVVGDLAGFCAATYMRGIRYVNIPTTSLSQIDSSIGGKTAVDMCGIKNCVGAFWQPSQVLIDPDTLSTLDDRQLHAGLAEAVKAGLIRDPGLFRIFEQDDYLEHIDEIIERSLIVKKQIVENDERESGERKLLNFGHTYGHAYESFYELGAYLHGECVAAGMMTVLKNKDIKERLGKVLAGLHLPVGFDADREKICELIRSDKKADHDTVTIVQVDEIGRGHLESWSQDDIRKGIGL